MRSVERVFDGISRRSARLHKVGAHTCAMAVLAFASAAADAQPAPTVPATSTGSYTVSYQPCSGCLVHWLEEKVGDAGAWGGVGYGSVSFTGKPDGRYYYRVGYYYLQAGSYVGTTTYGPAAGVTVSRYAPTLDTLERQLTYSYEVRRGDADWDGRADLFLNRTAGGTAGNGALEAVLLLQQPSGGFTAAVPTQGQRDAAKGWAAAGAALTLRDVNADGFADAVLTGVAAAVGATAAKDQIVFAPGPTLGTAPLGVRTVDGATRKFGAEMRAYLADPGYFAANAPLTVQTTVYWDTWCTYVYIDITAVMECYWTPVYVTTVSPDYSVFDPRSMSIWSAEQSIFNNPATRPQGLDTIEATVEQVLGVPVGGWDLSGRSGEAGSLDERDYRRGFELFSALFGIGVAHAQEAPRRSDIVYVTGRRIVGWLPYLHTALEYNRSTISAYDSDKRTLTNGVLVSQQNWLGDAPHLMMTLGTASRTATSAAAYWTQLLAGDSRYDDNLPYHPTPRAGEGRYNSNGYVHGLLRATGGTATVDMNRFPGGQAPVPAWAFN